MPSASRVSVRPVRAEDFDDLRETYYRLYDERDAGEPIGITLFGTRPSLEDEKAWLENALRRVDEGEVIFLVAEVGGHVVGSCTVGRLGPGAKSEQSHVGELGILVRQGMRGKGIGSALLRRALEEARSRFTVIYLSVFSINQGAQRLYQRFGFTHCGHLPRMVKRGGQYLDEERMVLVFPDRPA